jgi:phosphoribosylglycinamide formyltransferase-1
MFQHTIAAIDSGTLVATIEFVFMHRERGEGEGSDTFIDRVAQLGIPVANLSSIRFRAEHGGDFASHRGEFDRQVLELIRPYPVDVCIFAGYLLIISEELVDAYAWVNMHPALPDGPVGLWQKVIWELIDCRAEETGAMTFVVTEDVDKGPRLAYTRFSLRGPTFDPLWASVEGMTGEQVREAAGEGHPLFKAIRAEGIRREPPLITATLAAIADGSVPIDPPTGTPLDITAQVETAIGDGASRSD